MNIIPMLKNRIRLFIGAYIQVFITLCICFALTDLAVKPIFDRLENKRLALCWYFRSFFSWETLKYALIMSLLIALCVAILNIKKSDYGEE